ncbi:hypothetical protein H4R34_004749, partial [Dimargaris verticillata]
MGLSERKTKVAIGADPNNLAWRNDTSGFGYRMLAKMGWKSGKGLGANEDGTTKHVAIKRKGDNMGIGASVNTTDNWLNNATGFTALLERLNDAPADPAETPSDTIAGSASEPPAKGSKKKKAKSKKSKTDKRSKRKRTDSCPPDNDSSPRTVSDASDGDSVAKSKRHKDKKKRKKDSKHASGSSSASEMAITPEPAASLPPLAVTKPAP